jgi:hypothetical protein
MYLVGEIKKGGLLMVSLEWMMHNVGGYSVAGGEIELGRGPSLHSAHCECPTSASLACLLVEML